MRRKGSVTVFLSLTLAVVMALSGACLEYARVQVLSYQIQAAAASAEESAFAAYCGPLFERYQLLARMIPDGDEEDFAEDALTYANAYGNPESGMVNFACFTASDIQWSKLALATDENGAVFSEMAEEALLASEGEVILSEWLKRLGLTDSDTADTLKDNAGRGNLKSSDLLADYGETKKLLAQAEKKESETAEEESKTAQEESKAAEKESTAAEQESKAEEETKSEQESKTESEENVSADGKGHEEGKKFLNLLETVKTMIDQGVLGLVVPADREISSGSVKTGDLPSGLSSGTKSRSVRESGAATGNSLLLREYLLRNLSSFTSAEGEGAVYELEYVIAGKKTDKANLRAVVHRLLWMRTGLNLTYLISSQEKMKETEEAAVLAVGWTGQPLLVQAVRALLLSAWAFAESVCDVRTLLAGGKGALLKDDESWKLSFEKLVEEPAKFEAETEEDEEEEGMSYEDYLRICLYFKSESSVAYRGMDVIQWNMQNLGETDFKFANCAVSAELALTVQAKPVFSFLAGGLAKASGNYTITKKSSFGLLER